MTTGEKIRRKRLEKKMTQQELAQRSGIDAANIRKYESGKQNPKIETIAKIAAALEVQPSELIATMNLTIPPELLFGTIDFRDETEKAIADKVSLLNDLGKQKALDYVTDLSEQEKYKKQKDEE